VKSVPLQSPGLQTRTDRATIKNGAKGNDAFGGLLEKTENKVLPSKSFQTTELQAFGIGDAKRTVKNLKLLSEQAGTEKESAAEEGGVPPSEKLPSIDLVEFAFTADGKEMGPEAQLQLHNANGPEASNFSIAGQITGIETAHVSKVRMGSEVQVDSKSTLTDMKHGLKITGQRVSWLTQVQSQTGVEKSGGDNEGEFARDLMSQRPESAGAKVVAWNQSPTGFQRDIANSIFAALGAPRSDQVALTVASMMRDNATGSIRILRLRLHPAELGQLSIKMQSQGEELNITVQAQTAPAHDRIMAEKDEILRSLELMGISVSSISIEPLPESSVEALLQESGSGLAFTFDDNERGGPGGQTAKNNGIIYTGQDQKAERTSGQEQKGVYI
jgi:hypothetical protein